MHKNNHQEVISICTVYTPNQLRVRSDCINMRKARKFTTFTIDIPFVAEEFA